MGIYSNVITRTVSQPGMTSLLFQKTDFTLANIQVGSSWIAPTGSIVVGEQTALPHDVTGFNQVVCIGNFSTMTGTSPSFTIICYCYDDPAGTQYYDAFPLPFNLATGQQSHLNFGSGTNATSPVSNGTFYMMRPLWVRFNITSTGVTAIGANNRFTIVGMR